MQLKLGIVGAGRLGGFHAEKAAADPEVELVGVFDQDPQRTQEVAQKLQVKAFDSLESLAGQVEAAVVAAPTEFHYELARDLLEKNIHLLVEKPMTVKPEEAEQLVAIAKKNNLALLAGHTEQFNMAWRFWMTSLCEMIGEGPVVFHSQRTSGYTFRSVDVGAVLDLMIHDIELVLSVVPYKIVSVEATGFSTIGGYEDIADAKISFEDGTVANFFASRVHPAPSRSMSVQSAYQLYEIDFAARKTTSFSASHEVINKQFAPDQTFSVNPSHFMQEHFTTKEMQYETFDALALEMSDFVQTILYQRPSQILSGERAAKAIRVAAMILEKIHS